MLHEALQRAIRVAPTKGAGFDKAGGLRFVLQDTHIWVQATDLERTFFQKVPGEITAVGTTFRITSNVSKFIASLPMGGDQEVRFHLDDATKRIVIQYRKTPTKIEVSQITGEYPRIEWFNYDSMDDAFELAGKLQAVTWAIDDGSAAPINGVRIDGEWLEALSSKQMARIKCNVQTAEPIVAVVKTLAPLIAMGSKVRIKAGEGRVIVALDELSQVTSATVMGNWPNLSERLDKLDLPHGFTINRQRLLDGLSRIVGFVENDRFPRISFVIGGDRVTLSLFDGKDGNITDVIGLSSKVTDHECEFIFNPVWLSKAIETFPGSEVQVKYIDPRRPIRLLEPMTSYNALIMGLQPGEKVESPGKDD